MWIGWDHCSTGVRRFVKERTPKSDLDSSLAFSSCVVSHPLRSPLCFPGSRAPTLSSRSSIGIWFLVFQICCQLSLAIYYLSSKILWNLLCSYFALISLSHEAFTLAIFTWVGRVSEYLDVRGLSPSLWGYSAKSLVASFPTKGNQTSTYDISLILIYHRQYGTVVNTFWWKSTL